MAPHQKHHTKQENDVNVIYVNSLMNITEK